MWYRKIRFVKNNVNDSYTLNKKYGGEKCVEKLVY